MSHQTTPLRPAYEELPSLAFTSSPGLESPYPIRGSSYSGRFFKFPQSALPKPHRLTDALPSSPPDERLAPAPVPAVPAPAPVVPALAPAPQLRETRHEQPRKSPLGKRPIEFVEEYSIMGSDYGFCVDSTGHVHISSLKRPMPSKPTITREEILNQDSESEVEEIEASMEHNAVGAFARVLARSKIETAAPSVHHDSKSFFEQTTPRSQGSTLAIPSTPLSTGSFQANIMTPPGAMFTIDNLMYSTGMTPYLPKN